METLLPALFHLLLAMADRFCEANNPADVTHCWRPRQRHGWLPSKRAQDEHFESDLHKLTVGVRFPRSVPAAGPRRW